MVVSSLWGKDFDNPWGKTTPKGEIKKMSALLDSAVFPGVQGGPLEHVIAAKAVAFYEALQPSFKEYGRQVKKNAQAMAEAFVRRGYGVVSGGTDNHCMLIDLRGKFPELTGKVAEKALVAADITVNKNMVPSIAARLSRPRVSVSVRLLSLLVVSRKIRWSTSSPSSTASSLRPKMKLSSLLSARKSTK